MTLTSNPLLDLFLTYVTCVRNLWIQSSDLPHLQVVLMWRVGFFLFSCAPYLFHFHNCTHPTTSRVPLFFSFYTFIHCSMLYCPNPSCIRNIRNTRKAFPNVKSFSHHLQQSPECKPFVLNQTVVIAPTMQASSKEPQQMPLLICLRNSSYG